MEARPKISVVVPIFGNAGDLPKLVAALQAQTLPPHEIILVDPSPRPLAAAPAGTMLLRNPQNLSLNSDYNLGASRATGDFILNMQQDCVPEDSRALEKMFTQLTPGRVTVVAQVTLPTEYFARYNFWAQVLMARWVGAVRQGVSGKFDLHRREIWDAIGGYNRTRFHRGGEDMDAFLRLSAHGEVFISDVECVHYHPMSPRTTWLDVLRKNTRLAGTFGELFRVWGASLRKNPYAGHWYHHLAKYLYVLVPFWLLSSLVSWKLAAFLGALIFVGSNLCELAPWKIKSWQRVWLLLFNPVSFLACCVATGFGFLRQPHTGKS
jgi:glycosyltransferase involved in cell wall biosynthesis